MRMLIPLLGFTLVGLVAAVSASEDSRLHERETTSEMKTVKPRAVLEQDVVLIHWPRLHKRSYGSSTKIRLNAFGKKVDLWLDPPEGVLATQSTPVYFARSDKSSKNGASFSYVENASSTVAKLLEDRQKQASIIVKRSASGSYVISGHIASEGWIVEPLPNHFSKELKDRNRRSIDDLRNITVGDYEPEYHVIYKIPAVPDEVDYITRPIQDNILNKGNRSKRSVPSIIYPEIFVIVDHGTYKLFNEYLYDLLEYLVLFWNGVDLRYRALENPKVRLNIAGILIAKDADAISFLSKNKVSENMMNISGALNSLATYMRTVENIFPLTTYDIAVAMAPYDMCSPDDNGICKPGTLGLAYLSGACKNFNDGVPKTLSTAVIQDKGGFDGMHTAAHELGHLLGAGHDDAAGSVCHGDAGHIMAPTPELTENSADWSPCSLEAFNKFFYVDKEPQCLYNVPETKLPLPRILPGRLLSVDEQCAKIEGTKACPNANNICQKLRCIWRKDKGFCTDVGDAAADGTVCATGGICVHGKCILEKGIK